MARNQFKWLWLHTPTYAAYKVEGTSVPLLLAAGAATKSARSAILVLRSLTPNAQSVFRVLGEFQISHPDDQGRENSRWLFVSCVRISDLVALSRSEILLLNWHNFKTFLKRIFIFGRTSFEPPLHSMPRAVFGEQ